MSSRQTSLCEKTLNSSCVICCFIFSCKSGGILLETDVYFACFSGLTIDYKTFLMSLLLVQQNGSCCKTDITKIPCFVFLRIGCDFLSHFNLMIRPKEEVRTGLFCIPLISSSRCFIIFRGVSLSLSRWKESSQHHTDSHEDFKGRRQRSKMPEETNRPKILTQICTSEEKRVNRRRKRLEGRKEERDEREAWKRGMWEQELQSKRRSKNSLNSLLLLLCLQPRAKCSGSRGIKRREGRQVERNKKKKKWLKERTRGRSCKE